MKDDGRIEYKGYYILVEQDEDAGNPYREWDHQLSDTNFWIRNYDLDSIGSGQLGFESPQEVVEAYTRGEIVYYGWIYAYIHSGITIRLSKTNPYSCQWDSGLAGVVYVTAGKAKEEFPALGGRTLWLACERGVRGEVETLDQYLTGDVWGYWVWKKGKGSNKLDGECYRGFYGHEYCLEEAKMVVAAEVAWEEKRLAEVQDEYWGWSGAIMYGGRELV